MDISCRGCHKTPDELPEYVEIAEEEGMTPTAYMQQEEGTYNRETGGFLCTSCYIKAGMPSLPYPRTWKAQ